MGFGKWIGFIALIISLYVLWEIRQIVLLLFTAVILANALNALVKQFHRRGIKRGYAVLLTVLIVIIIFSLFFWLIIPPFAEQIQELIQLVPQGIEELNNFLNLWIDRFRERFNLDPELQAALPDLEDLISQLQPLVNQLLGGGWIVFSSTLGVLLNILLLLVLTLMMLADPQPYRRGFIRLFPSFYRRRVDKILILTEEALQGWLAGILFNMGIIAILSFLGLWILGIRLALAQAMLAGLLTFIPNLGPALSVMSPMIISLLDAPWKSLAVFILYVIIQQVEGNVLTPLVMAQQVSLLPAITLLAQVIFATFFGFFGLFLALPLTVVGQVWFKEVVLKDILDQWQLSNK